MAALHVAVYRDEWRDEPSGTKNGAYEALAQVLRRVSARDLDWIAYLWDEVERIPEFAAFRHDAEVDRARACLSEDALLAERLKSLRLQRNQMPADEQRRRLAETATELRRAEARLHRAERALRNLWRVQGLLAVAMLFYLFRHLNRHASSRRALDRLGAPKLTFNDVSGLDPELKTENVSSWQALVVQAACDMQLTTSENAASVANAWQQQRRPS